MNIPSFADIAKLATTQLPLAAHKAALNLAAAHNHMWACETKAAELLASASNSAELEGILVAIQAEAERLNNDGSAAPMGIELSDSLRVFQAGEEILPCYSRSTMSGRLAWNIVPDVEMAGEWFMVLSVSRPAVTVAGRQYPEGIALEARYSSLEGWSVVWGQGAPFYSRHLETLADAIAATGLVEGPLDDLPLIAHSIHADPHPDWRDGKQWWDVKLAAGKNLDRTGAVLIADLKTRFGTEAVGAFLDLASEIDSHSDVTRALRRAT